MSCPNELLDLYFQKFKEFQQAEPDEKTKLKPELKSLQTCIDTLWGIPQ